MMEVNENLEIVTAQNLPCNKLSGVGPQLSKRLQKLNISTIFDLLLHLPYRYQDRTRLTPIAHVQIGDYAVIEGEVFHSEITKTRRKSLICRIKDGSGILTIRLFHFYPQQSEMLKSGALIRCFGEARQGRNGIEMIHPECRRIFPNKPVEVDEYLTPIYPSTEGISQWQWRKLTDQALAMLNRPNFLPDLLPGELLAEYQFPDLITALKTIHRPPPDIAIEYLNDTKLPAFKRLALEELLAQHLSLKRLRMMLQANQGLGFSAQGNLSQQFLKMLPFELTNAQKKAVDDIYYDITLDKPMLRLVQGDVGCGKTVVAALAILRAIENNKQAVLMAPTEILAEQHFQNFQQWFEPLGINIVWMAGKVKGKKRQEIINQIETHQAQVAIGTHALFQEGIEFADLGLVVIDEQHRFGVHQRLALREKGVNNNIYPHQLVMTATPIPRTLSMLFYADLDCTIIDELPPGRTPVKTVAIPTTKRAQVIDRVRHACAEKKQVYWVCTLIEESEVLRAKAAEKVLEELNANLPEFNIQLIHGKMKPIEKETMMANFKQGEVDLLIATTVIEVGVDVPNASLMIIENSERLGLSQLHQLRGRVGRGSAESFCVLLYQTPLSQLANKRISMMRESNDGFEIAKKDLELRGAGEVLGTRQTGLIKFRVADLTRDKPLLADVQQLANHLLIHQQPSVEAIISRWLGQSEQYASV